MLVEVAGDVEEAFGLAVADVQLAGLIRLADGFHV